MKELKVVGKIFGVVYSIIFCGFCIFFAIIFFLGNFANANFYRDFLVELDFNEIPLSDFADSTMLAEYGEDASVQDYFVGELSKVGVAEEVSTDLIENEVIREKTADVIAGIVSGEQTYETEEEIEQLVIDILSDEEVEAALKETLPEHQMREVSRLLNYLVNGGDDYNAI